MRILLCILASFLLLPAEGSAQTRVRFGGGLSYPVQPTQFYDYWKPGISVTAGMVRPMNDRFALLYSAEYHRSSVDDERFFKRIRVKPEDAVMEGAASNLMLLAGNVRYLFNPGNTWRAYGTIGLGVLYSSVGEVVVQYPSYTAGAEGESSILLALPVVVQLEFPVSSSLDGFVESGYILGLGGGKEVNSGSASLRMGVSAGF